jgi:hypothetical protein
LLFNLIQMKMPFISMKPNLPRASEMSFKFQEKKIFYIDINGLNKEK